MVIVQIFKEQFLRTVHTMFGSFFLTFTHLIFDININLSNSPFDLWLPNIIHDVYI